MQQRIENFKTHSEIFNEIPNVCCLDTKNIRKTLKNGKKEKINLYYYINIIEKLKSGSFNSVYVINHINDNNNNKFVLRIPKTDSRRTIYDCKTDDDYDNEKMAIACVSSRYALLFSNLVKKNIFPNFVQIIDVYFCNGKFPVTIQEYCDNDLNNFFKLNNDDIKVYEQLIVQSLLTYYFMNNYLQISNFDAKCTNVLVKTLDSPIVLRYNFNSHVITIKTDKIALITDFDFTRGSYNNNMMYILESYIKDLSVKHTYYNSIHEVLNRLQPDVHLIDIVQFMIILLVFNTNKYIKNIVMNFLYDYVVRNINFFECIKKYYSNIISDTSDIDEEYNVKKYNYNELMQIDHIKYQKLLNRMMTYTDFHSCFGDRYIKQLYKIDRFYCELEEYMISHLESSTDENYICNIYAKTITRFIPALSVLFESVIKFKIINQLSIYETLLTMSMIFFFIEKNIDFNKEEYDSLGLICIYLTNHKKYTLNTLKTQLNNSNSKKYLYKILKKVLLTLTN